MKAELEKGTYDEIILIPETELEAEGLRHVSRGPYNLMLSDRPTYEQPKRWDNFRLKRCDVSLRSMIIDLERIYKDLTGKEVEATNLDKNTDK